MSENVLQATQNEQKIHQFVGCVHLYLLHKIQRSLLMSYSKCKLEEEKINILKFHFFKRVWGCSHKETQPMERRLTDMD